MAGTSPAMTPLQSEPVPKIEMRAGGQYESSLLLAENIWSSGQIEVDGDVVVAVPAKDALLVTGSGNQNIRCRMFRIASIKFYFN
jgi:uncharacterized protein YtpQ (UPF0354 family)